MYEINRLQNKISVAFSRVRNIVSIKIAILEDPKQQILEEKRITSNIVSRSFHFSLIL